MHRDVKPSNVLVDHGDHAYLADFGIAAPTSPDATALTGSGPVLGTWDYLAPERLSGKPVDGRADQYALACVLFECLTGRPPYPGSEPPAVVAGHLLHPPPVPSLLVPTFSPALDAVVRRGLAKNPERRFSSCVALVDAAEQALYAGQTVAAAAPTVDPSGAAGGQGWLIRAIVRSAVTRRAPVRHAETQPPPCPYPGLRSFEKDDAAWSAWESRTIPRAQSYISSRSQSRIGTGKLGQVKAAAVAVIGEVVGQPGSMGSRPPTGGDPSPAER